MPKFGNKLIDVAKFWIYWIIVVTLTIGLFFALMENANFEGKDLEFYLRNKETLRYNFRIFAVISFVLTYILVNPLINRFYKNSDLILHLSSYNTHFLFSYDYTFAGFAGTVFMVVYL